MTLNETTPRSRGRDTAKVTTDKKDDSPKIGRDHALLNEAFSESESLGLKPDWSPGKARFTFMCPKCQCGAVGQLADNVVMLECFTKCGPIDLDWRSRPLTSASFKMLLYKRDGLVRAAEAGYDWLIPNMLAKGQVTLLAARPGIGKTMASEAIGGAIVNGTKFGDWPVVQSGPVVFIDAEQGEAVIGARMRLLGLLDHVGVDLHIADGRPVNLAVDERALIEALAGLKPALVVFDTNRELNPAMDENDSGSSSTGMRAYKRIAEALNCAVLVSLHSGKGEGSEFRGSSAIVGACEIALHMERPDEADPSLVKFRWSKNRLGPHLPDALLRMDSSNGRLTWTAEAPAQDEDLNNVFNAIDFHGSRSSNECAEAAGRKPGGRWSGRMRQWVDDGLLSTDEHRRYVRGSEGAPQLGALGRTPRPRT